MNEKIEQVARAICSKEGKGFPDDPVEPYGRPRWRMYEFHAKAAIEAMREPTDDMLFAGHQAAKKVHVSGVSGMTIEAQTKAMAAREWAAYQAMIDEALK